MIIYTDRLIPKRFAGYTIGPIIFIRPSHKDDIGLIEHEKIHVKQFWSHFPIFGLLYRISKYRLKFEAQAYAKQLKYYTVDKTNIFADFLVKNYNLKITKQQAIDALKEYDTSR